jgi:hypothetical protein
MWVYEGILTWTNVLLEHYTQYLCRSYPFLPSSSFEARILKLEHSYVTCPRSLHHCSATVRLDTITGSLHCVLLTTRSPCTRITLPTLWSPMLITRLSTIPFTAKTCLTKLIPSAYTLPHPTNRWKPLLTMPGSNSLTRPWNIPRAGIIA